jgi:hypothetical protein
MVDYGDDRNDKEIEKDASWKALHDQIPRMPRETYHNERAHLTDRRDAAKSYVKGFNFKNEAKNMNKKLIRLTESDLHRIVKESVNKIINEIGDTPRGQHALGAVDGRNNVNRFYNQPTSRAGFEAYSKAKKAREKETDATKRERMDNAYTAGRNYGNTKGRENLGIYSVYTKYNDRSYQQEIFVKRDGVFYKINVPRDLLYDSESLKGYIDWAFINGMAKEDRFADTTWLRKRGYSDVEKVP